MSQFPSEIKIEDLASTAQRNGDIIAAVSLPDTDPGFPVLQDSVCGIRSIFRQKKIAVAVAVVVIVPVTSFIVIVVIDQVDLTILFDKVESFYLPPTDPVRDRNY